MILAEISQWVQKGRVPQVKELVQQALDEGIAPKKILDEGLLLGMSIIGVKFKKNEVFVPEVMIAARAMNAGISVLEPVLVSTGNKSLGKVIIGTVKGDLHDIGKNLVGMMIKGAGLEVIDIGVDVSATKFIDAAEEQEADIICLSALLTTTMPRMKEVIEELNFRGLRDKYIVLIGGAPVTEEYAKKIGADGYTPDASTAAEKAKELVSA